jgi:hypothetical protein
VVAAVLGIFLGGMPVTLPLTLIPLLLLLLLGTDTALTALCCSSVCCFALSANARFISI